MKKVLVVLALTASVLVGNSSALAQTPAASAPAAQKADPGITPNGVIGEVVAVDANAKQLFIRTDAGSVVVVGVVDSTTYLRLPPGETSLTKGTKSTLGEIGAGDRVFARGKVADDHKAMVGRVVIVNNKAEIEQKQERDRAEWKRRGVVGVISALNAETKEITLQARGAEGPKPVVIPTAGGVKLRRYAPDSVKFSEAKPGTFEELKVGDQLRAKGDKSADGTRFTAEEVVTGSFRTLIGTITAVDAATNQIKINTLQGNQPVTVIVSKDSMLKQIPAEFAQMMQQRGAGGPGAAGGGGAASAQGGAAGARPPAAGAGGSSGAAGVAGGNGGGPGAGGGGMRRMGDMSEMLERLPSTTIANLKPGSMVVFSTTGTDPTHVTAIQLVAGIEPLVAMMAGRPGGVRGPGGAGGGGLPGFGFGIGQP